MANPEGKLREALTSAGMDVSAVSSAAIRGEVDAGRVVLNGQVPMAARDDLPNRAGAVAELA
eukprot:5037968-Lingulodinium_polyedra.AAC.1